MALAIWIAYRSADRIDRLMGPTGSRTVTRLSAFLLLCIGVQILITGVEDVLGPLLAPALIRLGDNRNEGGTRHGIFDVPGLRADLHADPRQPSAVIDKAAAHCAEKKYDEAALLTDRLYPGHVHPGTAVPPGQRFRPQHPGPAGRRRAAGFPGADDTTSPRRKRGSRSRSTIVKGLRRRRSTAREDKDITWTAGQRQMSFKGRAYLLHFGLPNFFFHVTTAYNILRHRGVELGKRDFLGSF